jgi:hypothetical protein
VFGGLLVLVVLAKLPFVALPYYWDEEGWVTPVHWLSNYGLVQALPGFRPADWFVGHPPTLHVTLALLFRVFGESPVVAHLFILPFGFLGVYFTYRLGARLYGTAAGLYAALALFLAPVYFAQSGMFLGDVPAAALGVTAVYFALDRQLVAYLVTAIALVLVKETGAAIVASLVLYRLLTAGRPVRQALPDVMTLGVPLAVLGAFQVWQKLTTGEALFIQFPGSSLRLIDTGWAVWGSKLADVTRFVFLDQWRFIPSALVLIGVCRRVARRELLLFAIIVLAACSPFVVIYYLRRYLMPALPFVYIAGMGALCGLVPSRRWQVACVAALLALSVGSLADRRLQGVGEWDLGYVSVIRNAQTMYAYLGAHHPDARVAAAWPDSVNLRRPYLGYVETPMAIARSVGEPALGDFDVAVVSWPSAGAAFRQQVLRFVEAGALRLETRVERHGAYSELYVKTGRSP